MSDPSPFLEAFALVGTFTVVIVVLCVAISKLPVGDVAPRRRPAGPGPSRVDGPPSSAAPTGRDGPGPLPVPGGDA